MLDFSYSRVMHRAISVQIKSWQFCKSSISEIHDKDNSCEVFTGLSPRHLRIPGYKAFTVKH